MKKTSNCELLDSLRWFEMLPSFFLRSRVYLRMDPHEALQDEFLEIGMVLIEEDSPVERRRNNDQVSKFFKPFRVSTWAPKDRFLIDCTTDIHV